MGKFGCARLRPYGTICSPADEALFAWLEGLSRIHVTGGTGKENEHMVPVRDIPKASTCISTGRGETVGILSMSLLVDEDMLNSLGL